MAFIADVSYDDQNMTNPPAVNAGQPFVKGWRVRNSGTCPWTTDYRFDYADGSTPAAQMNGQAQRLGRAVNPGEVVDFQVALVAPGSPGTYQGFWQMRNAANRNFGTRVWVGIRVPDYAPPPTAPPPNTGVDVLFGADRTQINPGERVVFTWQVRNAQSANFYAEGDVNAQRNPVQFNGTAQVFPQANTVYSLRVTRPNGVVEIRQIAVQVAAAQAQNAPTIQRFTLAPDGQMNLGQCVTIAWEARGQINRVRLFHNGTILVDGAPATGSTQDCPQAAGQNTYILEVAGPTVATRTQRVLNVIASGGNGGGGNNSGNLIVNAFQVNPELISAGGCVTISWNTTNAAQVRVLRNGTTRIDNGQLSGSVVDCLPQSGFYGYRLEATGASGASTVRERAVTVTRSQVVVGPTAQP